VQELFLASKHYKIDFDGRFDVKMNTFLCVYTTKKLLKVLLNEYLQSILHFYVKDQLAIYALVIIRLVISFQNNGTLLEFFKQSSRIGCFILLFSSCRKYVSVFQIVRLLYSPL